MRTRSLLVAAAAGLLSLGIAMPASADTTTATVTVTGGILAITVPADAGNLGSIANTVGGGTISGTLGQVQVNDARSAAAGSGWVASVISTAFTPPPGPAIAASAVSYTAGTITKVGTATYTANDPGEPHRRLAAVTATGITGDNSATWNPTINVAVPGGMAPASTPRRSPTPLSSTSGAAARVAAVPYRLDAHPARSRSWRCSRRRARSPLAVASPPRPARPSGSAAGGIGLRLVDAPATARDDPRAQVYIVDHLAPGTVIHRRIEVSNTHAPPPHRPVRRGGHASRTARSWAPPATHPERPVHLDVRRPSAVRRPRRRARRRPP